MDSIRKSEVEYKLIKICERYLDPLGFRAVDLDYVSGGHSVVRIFIEPQSIVDQKLRGTSLADCRQVSELLGPIFEVEELISGAYDLEVSSPGLNRRLRVQSDFEKHMGSEIEFRLVERLEGLGSKAKALLNDVRKGNGGTEVLVENQGKEFVISLLNIKRANVVWRFDKDKKVKKGQKRNH